MSDIAAVDVAVVGSDPLWVVDHMNRLHTRITGSVVRDYVTLLEALDDLQPGLPAVVLCSPELSASSTDAFSALATERPELAIVTTTDGSDAAAAGFALPADDTEAIVVAVSTALAERRDAAPSTSPGSGATGGPAVLARAIAQGLGSGRGSRLVTVTAGKGGVGATAIAINLAAAFVADDAGTAILVDAHGATGDIGLVLGMAPPAHDDLDTRSLDGPTVNRLLVRHEAAGIEVVALPVADEHLTSIGATALLDVLLALDGRADVIVVDAPPELVLDAQLITFSERVLVVTTPDLASVKDTKVVIGALAEGDAERLAIVLNHPTDRRVRTSDDDIAQAVGVPVVADLPFDDHLADVDEPVAVPPARSGFGREMQALRERVLRPH